MFIQPNTPDTKTLEGHAADARPQAGAHVEVGAPSVRRLTCGEEASVLAMLKARPVVNVILAALILDHGLESLKNRGTFYGCFSGARLVGVALVGHHVLLAGGREGVECFADAARRDHLPEIRAVLAEQSVADEFCQLLEESPNFPAVRQNGLHELLSLSGVPIQSDALVGLRQARADEVDEVARMNNDAFVEMYGINPTMQDPVGFRRRILDRIERGRVWVVADDDGIVFKAEAVSVSDDAVYLEGIFTRPDARGAGLGGNALRELCGRLMGRHQTVCLLADSDNRRTHAFYHKLGFTSTATFRLVRYQVPINHGETR